jgi:hypothetical protein
LGTSDSPVQDLHGHLQLSPYLIVWVLLLIHQAYHIDVSFQDLCLTFGKI